MNAAPVTPGVDTSSRVMRAASLGGRLSGVMPAVMTPRGSKPTSDVMMLCIVRINSADPTRSIIATAISKPTSTGHAPDLEVADTSREPARIAVPGARSDNRSAGYKPMRTDVRTVSPEAKAMMRPSSVNSDSR